MKKIYACFILLFLSTKLAFAEPLWKTLPPTPALPHAAQSGYAPINGVRIWYAVYGQGKPIILLHGGLASSNYWGNQVPVLAKQYQVIVMDTRGHGRSTNDGKPYNYDVMAEDVVGLMDFLHIKQAAIVGWSDGAILGIKLSIHHPERIAKVFAFGANSDPSGTLDASDNPTFNQYANVRARQEYQVLSATPSAYNDFFEKIQTMWAAQPHFTKAEFKTIKTPIWIVDGDHDEGIKREDTEYLAANIPGAGLLILPNVSHFAFIQDPEQFNSNVQSFLKREPSW